jgi:shikimate kinase
MRFGVRSKKEAPQDNTERIIAEALGTRSLVLVGMPGCGKSAVGRRLAPRLGLSFVDADEEIERAAGKTIMEIFADHGEAYFRDGERRVIARLLRSGPQVLATGGGAFMVEETRDNIRNAGISIWLKAELPLLLRRVLKRDTRPLLKDDPEAVMQRLIEERYPIYATADITVESRDVPHETIVGEIIAALADSPLLGATDADAEPSSPSQAGLS